MTDLHCPIIHGGLNIDLMRSGKDVWVHNCCLRNTDVEITTEKNVWNSKILWPLREINNQNVWDLGCWTCQGNELAGRHSYRTGMLEKFGTAKNLSGPQHLNLMFDTGCNLACRTCSPAVSTFWQKHLRDNGIKYTAPTEESRADDMIEILRNLDLSNLQMVVLCGGETLLGNGYWRVAEALVDFAPTEQITLCFQTNGTQSISERNYKTIEKFQLVKLHISLDGVGEQFEYLRWPANWNQVTENILNLRDTLPPNVMFLVEETISIFNLYYQDRLASWIKQNFTHNRFGDLIDHSTHVVGNGVPFRLTNITNEYLEAIAGTAKSKMIPLDWQENPAGIKLLIKEIDKFDSFRKQDWRKTFPEVAEFYKRYL